VRELTYGFCWISILAYPNLIETKTLLLLVLVLYLFIQKLLLSNGPCCTYWQEIHIEWGKGLVQKREAESRLKEIEAEKSKPFARTRYLGYGACFSFIYSLSS
jgi:hypothetical protein